MPKKGESTRQKIVETSMHLFASKGYFRTSIGDIIAAAQITKGGLYGHFTSKQEIWNAAYLECSKIWQNIVLASVSDISDPLERLEHVVENSMERYLGTGVFEGGCMLFNSLVELSRQPTDMGRQVLRGFLAFSKLLRSWLDEAYRKGILEEGLDHQAIANFIMISMSGTGPLYACSKDPAMWRATMSQLRIFIRQLRRQEQPAMDRMSESAAVKGG